MFRYLKLKMEIKIRDNKVIFLYKLKKLFGKYKAIWNKTESLQNNELNTLPVYDDRDIKTW